MVVTTASTSRAIGGQNRRGHSSSSKTGHGVGYAYLHHAVDDHCRYVYSEILTDERKGAASTFMTRAIEHFASPGDHRLCPDGPRIVLPLSGVRCGAVRSRHR